MDKPYYVILTGGKNNAGDYLIGSQIKSLLKSIRPDRDVYELDAWSNKDQNELELINGSMCLILAGGPSLQPGMALNIYNLSNILEDINVPITMMGVGWHHERGYQSDIGAINLDSETIKLLKRVDSTGFPASVRDYHTQKLLFSYGFKNNTMTGCPVLYSKTSDSSTNCKAQNKVVFSLGVSHKHSRLMTKSMKELIVMARDQFSDSEFLVAFHHSIDKKYLDSPSASKQLYKRHIEFKNWLNRNRLKFVDISGSERELISLYDSASVHIGYRVHAHIYMTSQSKPSFLLAEDGRGLALKEVLGGAVFDAFSSYKVNSIFTKLRRFGINIELYRPDYSLYRWFFDLIENELSGKSMMCLQSHRRVNELYSKMSEFLRSLP